MQSEPQHARTLVWALPLSLAATHRIDVSFSSSGYLDVSVHRVPLHTLCIGVWILEVFSSGFPHSDISGSMDICSSPKLFAAYHVFHRLLVPRHPPCALLRLTFIYIALYMRSGCVYEFALGDLSITLLLVFPSATSVRCMFAQLNSCCALIKVRERPRTKFALRFCSCSSSCFRPRMSC